ncbi:MAG: tripartite tricarboxylate transporter substrate binding protein [Alphaproteobacteria bacterium]|nr:tripartite tricarboxylate transporter substrate binding protein [Alphaproteobacteria bacterium]
MRRRGVAIALGLIAGMAFGTAATAQTYPNKPVRIIVPYQAGQGTDVITRYLADKLSTAMGERFIVDNKPGAGGNIGTEVAARSPADGYTLLVGTVATHAMNEFMYPQTGFDAEKDFAPIILTGIVPLAISAHPAFPANSIPELIAAAKANPDKINIAMPSTSARMVYELLKARTGAPLFGVPYKGSATAMTEVIGGQVQLTIDTITATRGQVAGGKLKALAVTSLKSTELMPGVKSVAEQGVEGFEMTAWNALYAPKGTPPAIVEALNAAMTKILAEPETRARLLQMGIEPVGGTPAQLVALEKAERAKWGPLIKAAGLKGD